MMIWPWQYKKKCKEYEDRIHQLKRAGWYSVNGWEFAINNKDMSFEDQLQRYNWYAARKIFSVDLEIDNKGNRVINDTDYWNAKF